jgi:hypothetical protein
LTYLLQLPVKQTSWGASAWAQCPSPSDQCSFEQAAETKNPALISASSIFFDSSNCPTPTTPTLQCHASSGVLGLSAGRSCCWRLYVELGNLELRGGGGCGPRRTKKWLQKSSKKAEPVWTVGKTVPNKGTGTKKNVSLIQ